MTQKRVGKDVGDAVGGSAMDAIAQTVLLKARDMQLLSEYHGTDPESLAALLGGPEEAKDDGAPPEEGSLLYDDYQHAAHGQEAVVKQLMFAGK